jgi:hypothetical protein
MLLLLLGLSVPVAAPAACEELAGKYRAVETADYSSDFTRLDFRVEERGTRATLALWPEGAAAPRHLRLALDGQPHAGDGTYTGASYRASCEDEVLTIEAAFPAREEPLFYVVFKEEGELRLINAIGSYARITGRFVPER